MASVGVEPPTRPHGDGREGRKPAPRPAAPAKTEEEKQAIVKAEYEKLMNMKSGGRYIPPARLRALQAQINDDASEEGKRMKQKMHWEALKKSLNGLINKVNVGNIKHIIPELFGENLVRGRGLFCRSIMKAQAASLSFTPIFAAVTAAVNSRLPQVGELLVSRLVVQFRKSFRRNDKRVCLASTTFLAHLINFQVCHEFLALQMLLLLLNKPTDDSVEIAVGFMREVGHFLTEMQPGPVALIWDRFREILHEAEIDKRVQYAIEVLFQVRKDVFRDNPSIKDELDILEEEDMITHRVDLDGELETLDSLNVFKYDADFEKSEQLYKDLKAEILGEGSGSEEDEDDDEDESSEDEDEQEQRALEIKDQSNTDLINLRRTIYLTIQSSIDPEEACHKLMKLQLPAGMEPELPSMIMECCSQSHTFQKFYGLIGERFAKINRLWTDLFEQLFGTTYDTIHRFETNRLRNVARFFGHMFSSDAIGWHAFTVIHLNEEETTSSSRIFIKILFQDIAEAIGMAKLKERMKDPILRSSYEGIFPHDNARNIRFSINYFTSIGMGALTEEMREFLQNMPKPALPAPAPADDSGSDSRSSYSSYTGSSYSSRSRSPTPQRDAARRRSRSPARRGSPARSYSSRGRSIARSRSSSRDASPRRTRRRGNSYSASPPAKSRRYSRSRSRTRHVAERPARTLSPPERSRRQNSSSISRSPSPRRSRRDSYSASPPIRRTRRSPSPAPRSPRRSRGARLGDRSPSPASSDRSRSPSRSPSPPRRHRGGGGRGSRDSPGPRYRDHSRSRSPLPRRDLESRRTRSPSPVNGKKRRRFSGSRSRSRSPPSPPLKRERRGN